MNDPEKATGYHYRGPSTKDMLDWLNSFRYAASPFVMVRAVDHNGQSGTGIIADGVVFPDGRVNIRWRSGVSGVSQTESWDSLEHAMRIHGHRGDTTVTVIPMANIVHALSDALSVNGMMEVDDDDVSTAYADGWNACRRQVESYASKCLRTHFEPTLPEKVEA
jgi:hypothetical protein